jgi:hypothetical protein
MTPSATRLFRTKNKMGKNLENTPFGINPNPSFPSPSKPAYLIMIQQRKQEYFRVKSPRVKVQGTRPAAMDFKKVKLPNLRVF